MFHRCGCSAFITNLAYLIIEQNNAWTRGAGLLFLFSAGKFQVGRWKANAFGQGLTFCSGSTPLAILIVSTQTSPFQYLMFSSLFSLIIQLTVIFSWTGGAAAGSVRFPLTQPNLGFTAPRRPASRNSLRHNSLRVLSEQRCWKDGICDVCRVILWAQMWKCRRTWGRFMPMTSEGTGVVAALECCLVRGCEKICPSKLCCNFAPMNI